LQLCFFAEFTNICPISKIILERNLGKIQDIPPSNSIVLAIFGNSVYSKDKLICKFFPQFFVPTVSIQSIQPNLLLEIGIFFVNSAKKKVATIQGKGSQILVYPDKPPDKPR